MAISSQELVLLNYRLLPEPSSLASDAPEFTRRSCELNQTFVSITQRVYRFILESQTRHHGLREAMSYFLIYLHARLHPLSSVATDSLKAFVAAQQSPSECASFLATHLSWYNFEFLESLVGVLLRGDVRASYQLVAYRERMKELGMTPLSDVASSGTVFGLKDHPGTCCVAVWLDHTHKTCYLHDVHHVKKTLSTALGRSHCPLYLTAIETSGCCTVLSFLVLELICDELFPLQDSTNLHILRTAGIVRVECREYEWEDPKEKGKGKTAEHDSSQLQFILSDVDDPMWFENNSTPLHAACCHGLTVEVEWLLKAVGFKVLKRGLHGWSPLHAAAYGGHHHIVSLLLAEASPATLDDDNVTPLHVACFKGHKEIVAFLIKEKHVSPHISDAFDGTLVHYAAKGGQLEVIRFLVDEYGCSLAVENADGANPFLSACLQPNVSVIEYILEASQCSPLSIDSENQNALHYAAISNNPAVFRFLEQAMGIGFNLLATDDSRYTPCHIASFWNSLNMVHKFAEFLNESMLTTDIEQKTPILAAADSAQHSGSCFEMRCLCAQMCSRYIIRGYAIFRRCTWNPNIAEQQKKAATFLLEYFTGKYDLQAKDKEGINILHYACKSGNISLAQVLVNEYGLDPCTLTHDNRTVMSFAAFSGCVPLLRYFKKHYKLKMTEVNVRGHTLLHQACRGGSLSTVQYLIEEEKLPFLQKDLDNAPPFVHACRHGHLPIVQYFMEEQHVDLREVGIQFVFHAASNNGLIDLMEYLLEKGLSDLNCTTPDGYTCLHFACFAGSLPLVKSLIRHHRLNKNAITAGDGFTPLHAASYNGHKAVVRYLVEECSVDPKSASSTGLMPLHLACRNGHKHVAELLMSKYGCNVNATSFQARTPLHEACITGKTAVARYVSNLSECECPSLYDNNTLLHLACRAFGKLSLVKFLVEECRFPPQVNAPSGNGLTALHVACEKGFLHVVRYLIESNMAHCDPSSRTASGLTPLHCAARGGRMQIVRYLVTVHRCNPRASTIRNHTPIDAAIEGEHWTIMEYLSNITSN